MSVGNHQSPGLKAPAPPEESGGRQTGRTGAGGADSSRPTGAHPVWTPPTPAELSELLPQYRVEELVGRGGMGAIYKAHQFVLERAVAIKILPVEMAEDPTFVARFRREARTLAKLQHPGIVAIYDFGQTNGGHPYFVMEFVEGTDVARIIRSAVLKPDQALELTIQMCDALHYAHSQGVIHRDIKPANVLVTKDGRAKLADFGLARPSHEGVTTITRQTTIMGTPAYMAPEQHEGQGDQRADIYALGVLLYEMLTGSRPEGVFDLPSVKVRVDVRLDEVVVKAMQQEPHQRYQCVSEMRTDVDRIRATPPRYAQPPAWFRRRTRRALMAAVVLLLLASGGIVGWIRTHQPPQIIDNTASSRIEEVPPAPEKEEVIPGPQIEKTTTAPQTSNAIAAVLPPGLVGWWKAEGDAQDSAGTHHGALVEGAVFGPAKDGQGFLLNGYGAHVSVPASPAWAFGRKDFTMALWAYFASASGTKALIASDGGTDEKDGWVLWVSDGVLELRMGGPAAGGSGGSMGSARIKAALGPWCHIAVTRSGQAFRILVNGTERLSTTVLNEMPQSATALTFGCAGDAFHFHGTLDDIRIYDRALSDPEIKALVGAQSGTSTSGANSSQ